ncbi:MAG: tail fiber domain-containing protein [Candidatus Gastranaerophilales bacterium]|nr:tail fiber domain-containing protein [Candidatus Gastranaerophilales bacterium]MCM1073124.1 tail fiber domain-containing protein [Bacteroides sp.]
MKRLNGFSLMEMMVVLTIVAIVAAASAPMVNRKMVRSAAGAGSPWEWVNGIPGNPIFYNHERNNNQTASIGSEVAPNNEHPRLYIDSTDDAVPHIMFGRGNNNNNIMRLLAGGANNNIWLSTQNVNNNAQNTVAVGRNANASGSSSVAIGNGSSATGTDDAIAIGRDSSAVSSGVAIGSRGPSDVTRAAASAVAIGDAAVASQGSSIAIGSQPQSSAVNSISIGSQARSTAANGIAIGSPIGVNNADRTLANAADTIAIGTNARALRQNSIAIGRGAAVSPNNAGGSSSIAIGNGARTNQDDTIVIGRNAWSTGANTVALGQGVIGGSNAVALGISANGNASNAIAIGRGTTATAENAVAIGRGSRSTVANSIVIGIDAVSNPTDTTEQQQITKTIVLGDANTRVIIPGSVSFRNLEVRGDAIIRGNTNLVSDLYVGGRTVLGLRMYGYKRRLGQEKGDTSLVVGSHIADDNNSGWCDSGSGLFNKNNPGHRNWQFNALVRKENSRDIVAFSADRYDSESNVTTNGTIQTITRNAFTSFYRAIGESLPDDYPSDRRLKNVGKEFAAGLAELKKLDLYHYTYKEDEYKTPHVGVMAQDLQKIFPDAVRKGEDGFLRIRMEDMFYAVINAVKEIDSRVSLLEQQQKRIDELEKRIEALEKARK